MGDKEERFMELEPSKKTTEEGERVLDKELSKKMSSPSYKIQIQLMDLSCTGASNKEEITIFMKGCNLDITSFVAALEEFRSSPFNSFLWKKYLEPVRNTLLGSRMDCPNIGIQMIHGYAIAIRFIVEKLEWDWGRLLDLYSKVVKQLKFDRKHFPLAMIHGRRRDPTCPAKRKLDFAALEDEEQLRDKILEFLPEDLDESNLPQPQMAQPDAVTLKEDIAISAGVGDEIDKSVLGECFGDERSMLPTELLCELPFWCADLEDDGNEEGWDKEEFNWKTSTPVAHGLKPRSRFCIKESNVGAYYTMNAAYTDHDGIINVDDRSDQLDPHGSYDDKLPEAPSPQQIPTVPGYGDHPETPKHKPIDDQTTPTDYGVGAQSPESSPAHSQEDEVFSDEELHFNIGENESEYRLFLEQTKQRYDARRDELEPQQQAEGDTGDEAAAQSSSSSDDDGDYNDYRDLQGSTRGPIWFTRDFIKQRLERDNKSKENAVVDEVNGELVETTGPPLELLRKAPQKWLLPDGEWNLFAVYAPPRGEGLPPAHHQFPMRIDTGPDQVPDLDDLTDQAEVNEFPIRSPLHELNALQWAVDDFLVISDLCRGLPDEMVDDPVFLAPRARHLPSGFSVLRPPVVSPAVRRRFPDWRRDYVHQGTFPLDILPPVFSIDEQVVPSEEEVVRPTEEFTAATAVGPTEVLAPVADPTDEFTAATSPTEKLAAVAGPTGQVTAAASPTGQFTAAASPTKQFTAAIDPTEQFTADPRPTEQFTAAASSAEELPTAAGPTEQLVPNEMQLPGPSAATADSAAMSLEEMLASKKSGSDNIPFGTKDGVPADILTDPEALRAFLNIVTIKKGNETYMFQISGPFRGIKTQVCGVRISSLASKEMAKTTATGTQLQTPSVEAVDHSSATARTVLQAPSGDQAVPISEGQVPIEEEAPLSPFHPDEPQVPARTPKRAAALNVSYENMDAPTKRKRRHGRGRARGRRVPPIEEVEGQVHPELLEEEVHPELLEEVHPELLEEEVLPPQEEQQEEQLLPDAEEPQLISLEELLHKLYAEGVLRFTDICPLRESSRRVASKTFSLLLQQAGERVVNLTQERPWDPYYLLINKVKTYQV